MTLICSLSHLIQLLLNAAVLEVFVGLVLVDGLDVFLKGGPHLGVVVHCDVRVSNVTGQLIHNAHELVGVTVD